jgi:uncharacterized protein (TIGR04222 family)
MTLPWNPFDWSGPSFLAFYAVISVVSFITMIVWLYLADRSDRATGQTVAGGLGMLELAYLSGGTARACDAAVVALLQQDALRLERAGSRLIAGAGQAELIPALRAFRDAAIAGSSRARLLRRATAALTPIRAVLERHGLVWSSGARARLLWQFGLLTAGLCLFGVIKMLVGLQRGRPIGFLVILIFIDVIVALVLLEKLYGRTRAGQAALEVWAGEHRRLRRAPRRHELALAVALAGPAVLAGTAFAPYAIAQGSSGGDGGCSGGGGGGGGCGGGGCGGCGGS